MLFGSHQPNQGNHESPYNRRWLACVVRLTTIPSECAMLLPEDATDASETGRVAAKADGAEILC